MFDSDAPDTGSVRSALLASARAELVDHGYSAISLRAVARRAGVSHAAPKHYFGDRAGLLTAVAVGGFQELTSELARLGDTQPASRLANLGRGYIDFGLANPALFDLMFRPSELHPSDPALISAREESIATLRAAIEGAGGGSISHTGELSPLTLISWALAHGLLVLARDGALKTATQSASAEAGAELAHHLIDVFASNFHGSSTK